MHMMLSEQKDLLIEELLMFAGSVVVLFEQRHIAIMVVLQIFLTKYHLEVRHVRASIIFKE